MAFTPYITFDEFVAWTQLGGSAKAAVIEEAIATVTRDIDEYCQRHFWQDGTVASPVARTFETCNPGRLDLGVFHDLTSVASITVKTDEAGDGTFETTWAASDFQPLPFSRPTGRPFTSIDAVAGRRFPVRYGIGRRDRVQITGVWGWDAVPPGVKQACKLLAAREVTRMQAPSGFQGVGDFVIRIRADDPIAIQHLNPLMHPDAAVMVA